MHPTLIRDVRMSIKNSEAQAQLGFYFKRGIRFYELRRAIEEERPRNLLVLGCGNGYLESILDSRISTLSVDIDEEELEVAQILNHSKPNRQFKYLNLYDTLKVVEPGQFDAAAVSEVVEHLEDDLGALRVAYDCLSPNGVLFLTVPNERRFQNRFRLALGRHPKYMAPDHLREYTISHSLELVEKAGFRCRELSGLDFWLPKDYIIRRFVPYGGPVRRAIGRRWSSLATWLLLVCDKSTDCQRPSLNFITTTASLQRS